jgi:hypothetical protein
MAALSGPKRGIFGCIRGVNLKINFLSIFEGIFLIKSKNYFFRFPCKISTLTNMRFSNFGRFEWPKKEYFWLFFGHKLKINFLSIFEGILFHQVQELFF